MWIITVEGTFPGKMGASFARFTLRRFSCIHYFDELKNFCNTTGHRSYPRAIRKTLGNEVVHQTNVYLNNRIEQDHRGIKQRYYPMRGFGNFASAARFCRAFDELRHYFHLRRTGEEALPLVCQRQGFRERLLVLQELMAAIS